MVLTKSDALRLKPGDKAPEFALKNIDGKIVKLSQFKSKILVIIFICNHCPYVKPKMQEIADIQNEYDKNGVTVICINSNDPTNYPEDDFDSMKMIAHRFGYKYYLFDETQEIAQSYGATCTPDPFVFDKNHRLVYHGRINDAMNPEDIPRKHDIREVLDMVLKNRNIPDWFVPSMGCSIKWKD